MFDKLRQRLSQLILPLRNSMSLPNQFLKYGNGSRMASNWSDVMISDKDLYTGYGYAVIRNRAVKVAQVASEHIRTETENQDTEYVHPYLDLIWDSKLFTEYAFWSTVSTFLDLEGVYYLMIVRASGEGRTGAPKYFKMLNPYNVRRVLDKDQLNVEGYVETRKGFVREIPKDMIIEIRDLNPFSEDDPFSMTDAAKESQFTLKASGDYTRNVIAHNINAPGVLSTDVILPDPEFVNFKARVTQHTKGEPLFGNGSGAITWQSMTQDLSKAALKDTNDISVTALLAAAGVSKTIMGIEQSGVTRETSKVQKDLFIEGQIIPRIQLILDALNLDYRNHYDKDYATNGAYLCVDNPQEVDQAAEKTKAEVKKATFELFQSLLSSGYTPKKAAAFIEGELELEDLGKPRNKPEEVATTEVTPTTDQPVAESVKKKDDHIHNQIEDNPTSAVSSQQNLLKQSIMRIERELVTAAINRVEKNQYNDETDVVSKKEKKYLIEELTLVLSAFYTVIFQLQGPKAMDEAAKKFGLVGTFKFDRTSSSLIKDLADLVARSHIQTITDDVLKTAQEAALEGLSQPEIVSRIKQKYADDISTTRAETIARTETNRAFTMAQYQADRQFISQNGLEGRAYKKWKTRSDDPCSFCLALASEGLIPFDVNFRDLGSTVLSTVDGKEKVLDVNFIALEAGNAHPNCSCIYELVIK